MVPRLLMALAMLGATAAAWAAAPPVPWSKEQRAKLAERARLEKSLRGLYEQEKDDELIAAMRRIAELGREVLGETDPEVAGSFRRLALLHEALGPLAEAVKARREVLRLQEKRSKVKK